MSNRGTESHLPHQTVGGGVAGKLDIQARGGALRAFCFIRCYWIFRLRLKGRLQLFLTILRVREE
jgi:hypothetical protein